MAGRASGSGRPLPEVPENEEVYAQPRMRDEDSDEEMGEAVVREVSRIARHMSLDETEATAAVASAVGGSAESTNTRKRLRKACADGALVGRCAGTLAAHRADGWIDACLVRRH
jgi:hypothetical protein